MEENSRVPSFIGGDSDFLTYATTSWVAHTKQSDARCVPQEDLLDCFEWPSNALVERWTRIYKKLVLIMGHRRHPHRMRLLNSAEEGTSLVHVMSIYGVVGPLMIMCQRADETHFYTEDSEHRTPLLFAARAGHEAVVRLLLNRKANTEATDKSGQTPLLEAADKGREAVVRLLLDWKANTEATNDSGLTPLFIAACEGHKTIVRLLLDWKANTEATMNSGQTPLFVAACEGHKAIVRLLLDRKANTEATTKSGRTPLLEAASKGIRP